MQKSKYNGAQGKKRIPPAESYFTSSSVFIPKLAKKKVKFSLTGEDEWETYFLQEAKQALALKSEISKTYQEIDRMVYELYGLTE